MTRENDKMCKIPYEVDKDSLRECGIAGISMKDIHEITIGSRRVNVIFVEGNKVQYDEVMNAYSRECKRRDRDRRCMVGNGKGRMIRCPERVMDSMTGEMVANCCKDCPYYYSLDKKNYYTATFTDLSYEKERENWMHLSRRRNIFRVKGNGMSYCWNIWQNIFTK